LLGPNGAGKTTSFYMMVGLITPNEGRYFWTMRILHREPVYKRARKGVLDILPRKHPFSET
jgi:lipopolysaccharide export system ATP-binding protein